MLGELKNKYTFSTNLRVGNWKFPTPAIVLRIFTNCYMVGVAVYKCNEFPRREINFSFSNFDLDSVNFLLDGVLYTIHCLLEQRAEQR